MSSLLLTKEYIKQIYAKNEAYIDPILKFLMAMIVFMMINSKIGYMERIDSMTVVLNLRSAGKTLFPAGKCRIPFLMSISVM